MHREPLCTTFQQQRKTRRQKFQKLIHKWTRQTKKKMRQNAIGKRIMRISRSKTEYMSINEKQRKKIGYKTRM